MHELSGGDVVVLVAFAIAAMKIFTGPIGAAIGDRIRGRREADVDRLQARVNEVEERLDFAERLLTSREQPDQLPGGALR
jgi:hypothetical protein